MAIKRSKIEFLSPVKIIKIEERNIKKIIIIYINDFLKSQIKYREITTGKNLIRNPPRIG